MKASLASAFAFALAVSHASSISSSMKPLPSYPCSPTVDQKFDFFNVTRYETNYTSNKLFFDITNTYINYTTRCNGIRNPNGWTDWIKCENEDVPTYFMRTDEFNSHEHLIMNQTWVCNDNPASNPNNAIPRIVTAIGDTMIDMCMPLDHEKYPGFYFNCYPSGEKFMARLQHAPNPPRPCPAVNSTATWTVVSFTFESSKRQWNWNPWTLPGPSHIDIVQMNTKNVQNNWEARCFGGAKGREDDPWPPVLGPGNNNDVWQTCPTYDETVDRTVFPDRRFKFDFFGTRVLEMEEVARCTDGRGLIRNVTSYGTTIIGNDTLKCTAIDPNDKEEKFNCGPISFEVNGTVTQVSEPF